MIHAFYFQFFVWRPAYQYYASRITIFRDVRHTAGFVFLGRKWHLPANKTMHFLHMRFCLKGKIFTVSPSDAKNTLCWKKVKTWDMVVLPIQYILVINASRRFRPESCVPLFYALCMQWQTKANTMVCKKLFTWWASFVFFVWVLTIAKLAIPSAKYMFCSRNCWRWLIVHVRIQTADLIVIRQSPGASRLLLLLLSKHT